MLFKGRNSLSLFMFLAILLAIGLAAWRPDIAVNFEVGGEIFLRLLKMLVIPVVLFSVMHGIVSLGDVRKLGRPGSMTILYYLLTTIVAVFIGFLIATLIEPGAYAQKPGDIVLETDETLVTPLEDTTIPGVMKNLLLMLFSDNLLTAASESNFLPLIIFSIAFAAILTTLGSRVSTLSSFISQTNEVLMAFIMILMKVAPIGVFCLVATSFGKAQLSGEFVEKFNQTGTYFVSVMTGLGIHALFVLPLILWLFTKRNPLIFMQQISQALMTAFSTSSSSATLPVTVESAVEKAQISKKSSEFVLPIGATVNMDGTALYEAVAAIFIAQIAGIELTMMQQLLIIVTATLAAIGAAGIPEAGVVTMVIVLNAVGLPLEYMSFILVVDWLLDRFRTAVNVMGDLVGAAVVDKTFDG